MLAVKASLSSLSNYVNRQSYEVACINGPNETVLSGTISEVDLLSIILTAQNIKSASSMYSSLFTHLKSSALYTMSNPQRRL